MSSSIWTRCAGSSEIRPARWVAWRAVESQHQIATRKLVDSDAEQAVLEHLIESAKPPDRSVGRLHYLLSTPFRYPPLRHGSRFGSRFEPGLWYGAETVATAFAEVAYYRLLFLDGSRADLGEVVTELTAFTARIVTRSSIDLRRKPFDQFEKLISSPTHYRSSQSLGREMRAAGVEAFRYRSARDPGAGTAIAVFTPQTFAERRPRRLEAWRCGATKYVVEFTRRDYFTKGSMRYPRADFLVDGGLPAPAS